MSDVSDLIGDLSPEQLDLLLLRLSRERKGISRAQITRQGREVNTFPLSFDQQRMWLLDQLAASNLVFNIAHALRLTGPLNVRALYRSINEIVRRHEILRTTFTVVDGQPSQLIAPALEIALSVVDICELEQANRERAAFHSAAKSGSPLPILDSQDAQASFDLSEGPLLRTTLFRLAEDAHVLLVTMHHIVSDGWSMGVFFQELSILYEAFSKGRASPLPELPIQYADFAVWQRQRLHGEVLEDLLAYWRQQLSGELPVLELPTDRPHPPLRTFQGAAKAVLLPRSLTESLRALSRREGVTLFMTLLAAFNALLHRYTGQTDILVGTPIANRDRVELEGLIGFFTNTLVMRTDLSGNPGFRDLLLRVREMAQGAYEHQDLPFDRLVEMLNPERDLNRNPLFQIEFAFQHPPISVMNVSGLKLSPLPVGTTTEEFDLSLNIIDDGDALTTSFEYSIDLFDDVTITRMLGHLQTLLEGVVANPEQRLSDLPLLTDKERHLMLVEWNNTQMDYPKDLCIHQVFESQVEQTPDAVAVTFEGKRLSYRELNQQANQLAHYLQALGVGPETIVGICVERSLEMVVGTLGILKAGGAHVPLDPTYPKERLAFMLGDAQPSVLVAQKWVLDALPEHGAKMVYLDADWNAIARESTENPVSKVTTDNLAYVIYTSGSTGKPKGAMVTHGSLVNAYYAWDAAYPLRSGTSSHLQMASFSFDVFTGDLVRALCFGAKLVLCPQDWLLNPEKIYELMRREKVDYAEFVPALLRSLIRYLRDTEQSLDFMRLLIVGSDIWYMNEYRTLFDYCGPETRVINSYGLTEATIDSAYFEADYFQLVHEFCLNQPVPIGRPFPNTRMYIMDRYLQPVPVGVPGELYIGGEGPARGYFDWPDLTAERFIPDPFTDRPGTQLYKTGDRARYCPDGTIELLGRVDNQVKIRGFRIEPGEIEAILQKHPSVRESVLTVREDVPGNRYLVAYIVPSATATTASELGHFLEARLPKYMVPSVFMMLDALPLTPNGKIDRNALPAPKIRSEDTYIAPRNDLERTIADIWRKLLGVERITIHDSFFELGGHSLLASQLVRRLCDALKIEFPLRKLFESPTVYGLAEAVEEIRLRGVFEEEVTVDLEAEVRLDPMIPDSVRFDYVPDPACVFLTGATGFVGACLLRDMLEQTEADIYCLVRASDGDDAKNRIRSNLKLYQLWNESLEPRIMPVLGDLSRPYLGLSTNQFEMISHRADTIYHCGYWVNFIYPYHMLKATNVLGTQEVLRLAGHKKLKPVHFISTVSVFSGYPAGSHIREDDDLEHSVGLPGGYIKSKWAAEKIIKLAHSRGIPACIYRLGLVGGHSQTGISNAKDLMWSMVKGCIQLGSAPALDMMVDLAPVDYVSEAIIHLSRCEGALGKSFHLFNPHTVSWKDFVDIIRSLGYSLRQVPFDEWRATLISVVEDSPDNALAPFAPLFQEQVSGERIFAPEHELQFDQSSAISGLADTSIVCPPIDELLATYLTWFIRSGFLDAPTSSGAPVWVGNSFAVTRQNHTTSVDIDPFASATEMLDALRARRVSALELLELHLQRIERYNPILNAIVTLDRENARRAAAAADRVRSRGEDDALLGLPLTIKDSIDVRKLPSTAGSTAFADNRPDVDGLLAARVRAAGAVIMGKTNLAYRLSDWQTANPLFGRTNNPWDSQRTPGGSTGGGAAAVAAGLTPMEFGSDWIGSIRIPAAFCGIYGHKPSETAFPRSGQFPAPQLFNPAVVMTVQGPLARSAEDLELAFSVAAGPDVGEDVAWQLHMPPARHKRLSDYRVAILPPIPWLPVDNEILNHLENLTSALGRIGTYVKVAQPEGFGDLRDHHKLTLSIISAQANSLMPKAERCDLTERIYADGDEFDVAWANGLIANAAGYLDWVGEREKYRAAYRSFFREWDVLIAPITLSLPFPHTKGSSIWIPPWERCILVVNGQEVNYGWQAVYPGLANLSGLPATAFPVGLSHSGLPIGLQAIGPYLEDHTPIQFAELVAREFGGFRYPPGYDAD